MRITKKKQISVDEVTHVKCDKCGKKMKVVNGEHYAGAAILVSAGYGSEHDGSYELDLCDECTEKTFKSIKDWKNLVY